MERRDGSQYDKVVPDAKKIWLFSIGALVLMILLINLRPITIVRAGHVAVLDTFGQVAEDELSSGLRLKGIFAKPIPMSIRTQSYTMSIVPEEGQKQGNDSIDILTSERMSLALDLTALFKLQKDHADDVYRALGTEYIEDIIRPAIRTSIRDAAVFFDTKQICSETRVEFVQKIEELMRARCGPRGVIGEEVLLRNIDLPPDLDASVTRKLVAQQDEEAMEFVVGKAREDSLKRVIDAGGIAAAQKIIKRDLTPAYLRWNATEMMKGLAGSENTTFVFVPIDGNGIPVVTLGDLR